MYEYDYDDDDDDVVVTIKGGRHLSMYVWKGCQGLRTGSPFRQLFFAWFSMHKGSKEVPTLPEIHTFMSIDTKVDR